MNPLSKKIRCFPKEAGVYLMKNGRGEVLYIGKARNLKNRVFSYFKAGGDGRYQIDALMKNVDDIEYIITKNEKEALLLESNLIKEHRPRYNIELKDNKRYVSIKVNLKHSFPGIFITRKTPKDGSIYFGPYTSSQGTRETREQIVQTFKIRTCSDHFFANRARPCVQYEIKRCLAPCVGLVSKDDYTNTINQVILFLKGECGILLKQLNVSMNTASLKQDYEAAAKFRDIIKYIETTVEPQAVSGFETSNKDYIAFHREGENTAFVVAKLRGGIIKDVGSYLFKDKTFDNDTLWEQFLIQYYKNKDAIQKIIFMSNSIKSLPIIKQILAEKFGSKILISIPKKGINLERMNLARKNAAEYLSQKTNPDGWTIIANAFMKNFGLKHPPESIECVDISNISGKYAAGSLVTFVGGRPDKNSYRRFKIRAKTEPDDYGMMEEVLKRRFSTRRLAHPDLLIVDGGKGQLAIAKKVLSELEIENIPVIAIAKGKKRNKDEVFVFNRKNPVVLSKGSPARLFLQQIRDEAHRFAIKYYRELHQKGFLVMA